MTVTEKNLKDDTAFYTRIELPLYTIFHSENYFFFISITYLSVTIVSLMKVLMLKILIKTFQRE